MPSTKAPIEAKKPSADLARDVDVPKPKPERKRLNLDLAPAAYKLLSDLSTNTDKSMTDVLRTSLALYSIAYDAQTEGNSIGIIKGNIVLKEIVIT